MRLPLLAIMSVLTLGSFVKAGAAPAGKEEGSAAKTHALKEAAAAGHIVMTWVAPYAIEKSKTRLDESFDGNGMQNAITHLGLQFWTPMSGGGIGRTPKYGEIKDDAVSYFVKWGHAHGVRVMLCVYNNLGSWDWALAREGFAKHPKEFADALVAEVERQDLDGVDIDLEGEGSHDADKDGYVRFIRDLSAKLHAKGKHLTVDSFSYRWNAPNQTWWPELLPLVDGLTSMGYEEIGFDAKEWRGYAAQKAAAGSDSAKLLIGVPSDKDKWQNHGALDQIDWIAADGGVGVAIWDAQLEAAAWRRGDLWAKVRKIAAAAK